MPNTPNFAIPYPDGTTAYTPVQGHFAAMADAVDSALVTGLGGAPRIANSDSERNTIFPAPVQGNMVVRPDKGYTEQYYGLFDSGTNPGGSTVAGWYPVSGLLPGFCAKNTGTQNISTTAVPVVFPNANDTVSRGNISLLTTGIATIAIGGVYRVYGQVPFAAATNGSRVLQLVKNGTAVLSSIQATASIATLNAQMEITFAPGDTIALYVVSGNAVTIGVGGGAYNQTFQVDYISPPR